MDDLNAKLEKLRVDAEDCELIAKMATDLKKRALFAKLALHLRGLAREVEDLMAGRARATDDEAAYD